MIKSKFLLSGVLLGLIASAPALAAEESKSPLNEIYKCKSITDDAVRLACFDESVLSIQAKEENKELVAIDAEQAREIERDSFGLSLPSLPKIGLFAAKKDAEGNKLEDIQSYKVKSYQKTRTGLVVTMENGHIWKQTSGDIGWIPKGELVAKIKKASLGSFFLTLENEKGQTGRKGVRFRRVE